MANELGQSPKVVICPDDSRQSKTSFETTDNSGISYFIGINASASSPSSILGGDRNLGPGKKPQDDFGFSPDDFTGKSVLILTNSSATPITWSAKMHSYVYHIKEGGGNLLMGDGSAQYTTSSRLRSEYQARAGAPLPPPLDNTPKAHAVYPSLRLIFP